MIRQYFVKLGKCILYALLAFALTFGESLLTATIANDIGISDMIWGRLLIFGLPLITAWIVVYYRRTKRQELSDAFQTERQKSSFSWVLRLSEWRSELFAFLTVIVVPSIVLAVTAQGTSPGIAVFAALVLLLLAGVGFAIINTVCWLLVCITWKKR